MGFPVSRLGMLESVWTACYLQSDDVTFVGGWLCWLSVTRTVLRTEDAGSKGVQQREPRVGSWVAWRPWAGDCPFLGRRFLTYDMYSEVLPAWTSSHFACSGTKRCCVNSQGTPSAQINSSVGLLGVIQVFQVFIGFGLQIIDCLSSQC